MNISQNRTGTDSGSFTGIELESSTKHTLSIKHILYFPMRSQMLLKLAATNIMMSVQKSGVKGDRWHDSIKESSAFWMYWVNWYFCWMIIKPQLKPKDNQKFWFLQTYCMKIIRGTICCFFLSWFRHSLHYFKNLCCKLFYVPLFFSPTQTFGFIFCFVSMKGCS